MLLPESSPAGAAISLRLGRARILLLGKSSTTSTALSRLHGSLSQDLSDELVHPLQLIVNRQVHSNRVVEAEIRQQPAEADGIFSSEDGLALGVVTADCVPILLADRHGAIAAVHAGWRGLSQGIPGVAVEKLRSVAGEENITAILGPAIGACCYEVGWPVAHRLAAVSGAGCVVPAVSRLSQTGRPHVDLIAAARSQLQVAGVSQVQSFAVCTRCDPSWYSYRRDGSVGHNLSVIWTVPEANSLR